MTLDQLEAELYTIFDAGYTTGVRARNVRRAISAYYEKNTSQDRAKLCLDITFAHTDTTDVECIMSIVDYLTRLNNL